jgi:excisionase family DNA binding protein
LAPFLVPGPDPSVNGNGHRALAVQAPAGRASSTDLLRGLATLLLAVSEKAGTDRTGVSTLSTLSPDRYYTLAEAAVYTNLTPTYLRRRIQDGTLKAIKDRGWKIRRKDLEQV